MVGFTPKQEKSLVCVGCVLKEPGDFVEKVGSAVKAGTLRPRDLLTAWDKGVLSDADMSALRAAGVVSAP